MRQVGMAVVAVLAITVCLGATPQRGGWHEDARCGFKLKPPKDWEQVPLKVDEGWHVAKYLSKREYFWTDKDGGWTWTHKPQLTAIAFSPDSTRGMQEAAKLAINQMMGRQVYPIR